MPWNIQMYDCNDDILCKLPSFMITVIAQTTIILKQQ